MLVKLFTIKLFIFRLESRDIEDGAERILNQVLAPRTLNIFEAKIAIAVNDYFGIKNEVVVPSVEQNGMYKFDLNIYIYIFYSSLTYWYFFFFLLYPH